MDLDLRHATFTTFLDTAFDHAVDEDNLVAWYYDANAKVQIEPERAIDYLTRVFERPQSLTAAYSIRQIEQGLWFLSKSAGEHFLGQLWNPVVAWDARARCIAAVYFLYDELLCVEEFETIDYMLTDFLATDDEYHAPGEDRAAERSRVRGALIPLFARLLDHPTYTARYAALHGFGHLNIPEGAAKIRRFLQEAPYIEDSLRQYAEDAIEGAVL